MYSIFVAKLIVGNQDANAESFGLKSKAIYYSK